MINLVRKANCFLDSLNGIASAAEDFQIIETPRDFREKLLELIQSAERRIYITALYLQDDEAGAEILQAIYQAKQKKPDLEIKIFVDYLRAQRGLMGQAKSVGNVRLYREFAQKYEYPVDILGVPVKSKEVFGVLHLKGFIFDDTLLYSGASLNNIYLHHSQRYRYDRYHLIQNKTLTDSMVGFLRDYLLTASAVKPLTEDSLPHKDKLKPLIKRFKNSLRSGSYLFKASQKQLQADEIFLTPLLGFGGRKNLLNQAIYEMLRCAQQQITIYTPYFNFPGKINRAINRALKQGKQVNIVVGDKKANDFYIAPDQEFNKIGIVPYVYEANLRAFVKRNQKFIDSGRLNVYLWQHQDNSFHLKGISCDDRRHLITGHNINPRAWSLDLENGILIQDKNQRLKAQFDGERKQILYHTCRIEHFKQIEMIKDYPEAAKKLMRSVKGAKLDSILNRLL